MVGCCLQHNHSFHQSHDRFYARNPKLTPKQESHLMGAIEIFGNAREVCRYARENFNCLVTVRGMNILRCMFKLMDVHNDVVRVKELLREQGALRFLKHEGAFRFALLCRIGFGIWLIYTSRVFSRCVPQA